MPPGPCQPARGCCLALTGPLDRAPPKNGPATDMGHNPTLATGPASFVSQAPLRLNCLRFHHRHESQRLAAEVHPYGFALRELALQDL